MIAGPLPDDIPPGEDFPQMWKILWKNDRLPWNLKKIKTLG
jgi:hypothetical protein